MKKIVLVTISLIIVFYSCKKKDSIVADTIKYIKPSKQYNRYWQYNGIPVFLIGTVYGINQFLNPDIHQQLELLTGAGGNFTRNPISLCDTNHKAFKVTNGICDFSTSNNFWEKLDSFYSMAQKKSIIIQQELWNTDDYTINNWQNNSFNELKTKENISFLDATDSINIQLKKQYINKLLSYSLKYNNIIYSISNGYTIKENGEWIDKWISYINEKAKERSKIIYITENINFPNVYDETFMGFMNRADTNSFLEISANCNTSNGQEIWDNQIFVYNYISDKPKPINTSIINNTDDSKDKIWKSILCGSASICLNQVNTKDAATILSSIHTFLKDFSIVESIPGIEAKNLFKRDDNEAFITNIKDESYAIYFPKEGEVILKMDKVKDNFYIKWFVIESGKWSDVKKVKIENGYKIKTPVNNGSIVVITKNN